MHEDKEHDAYIRIDDAEERGESVERLIEDDAAFGCEAYFGGNLVFHESCTLRIPPTGEEGDPKQK